MKSPISTYIKVESDQIDSPNSEIIKTKIVEGRSCKSYIPVSYDGSIHEYFRAMAGHELGGPTTIVWTSNLCMQMGKFYAPSHITQFDKAESVKPTNQTAPTKSMVKFFEVKKPSFIITPHQAGHNFFHFLVDSLPRFSFREHFSIFSTPILFSGSRQNFHNDTMNVLLHKKYPIYDTSYRVLLRECAITWPLPRTVAVDFLRKKAARITADTSAKRIYISRRSATFRQVTNEIELEPILKKFGFTIIECESITFYKQISIFKGAEIVCGPHGAGLTNIAFCQKNTSILEFIMNERLSLHAGSAFWELACVANLDYHILSAQRVAIDKTNPVDGAMYIDPQKFEAALDHLIKHRK